MLKLELCVYVVALCVLPLPGQDQLVQDEPGDARARIVPGYQFYGPQGDHGYPEHHGPPGFHVYASPQDLGLMDPTQIPWSTETMLVRHAGQPRHLAVYPAPLPNSDHELMFNVSWAPPEGGVAPTDYSLEVHSVSHTSDCDTSMCYDYNIPGEYRWWLVPAQPSPLATACAVRPGCAYEVRLTAHPWDGHSVATLSVELDECVAGVCSCGHSPRLPSPLVSAKLLTEHGDQYVNVTWDLPPPAEPLRLPPSLRKAAYFVSIGKQMVSEDHPAPWFAHIVTKRVPAIPVKRPVILGDRPRSLVLLLPAGKRARMLARVSLIDDRGCFGPPGNNTVDDATEERKPPTRNHILWVAIGIALALVTLAVFAVGARGIKRLIHLLKPSPAPLEPLRRRPAWLPLQPTNRDCCNDSRLTVYRRDCGYVQLPF